MRRMVTIALMTVLVAAGCGERMGNAAGGDRGESTRGVSASELQAATGTLAGKVTRAPTCPAQRPGEVCVAPAAGVLILVVTSSGEQVATAVSDIEGAYRVTLSPGSYWVRIGPLGGMEFTRDLPAAIAITAGQRTQFDIKIDTGIR